VTWLLEHLTALAWIGGAWLLLLLLSFAGSLYRRLATPRTDDTQGQE
jgi:hypothetical protein